MLIAIEQIVGWRGAKATEELLSKAEKDPSLLSIPLKVRYHDDSMPGREVYKVTTRKDGEVLDALKKWGARYVKINFEGDEYGFPLKHVEEEPPGNDLHDLPPISPRVSTRSVFAPQPRPSSGIRIPDIAEARVTWQQELDQVISRSNEIAMPRNAGAPIQAGTFVQWEPTPDGPNDYEDDGDDPPDED